MALSVLPEDGSLDRLAGDLADETRLPRELITRFGEMWHGRERPFFSQVDAETGLLPLEAVEETVRSLKISVPVLYKSVARVISDGAASITFEAFVRGYAKLHARNFKQSLPFAFAVFDLDGDGILGQEEFRRVLDANLEQQSLDPAAINRVLGTAAGKDAAGVSYDAFRYFASLSSETILACCGMCLHVRDFYVPLEPLGTEAEEAADEAEKAEQRRRDREREHAPKKPAAAGAEAPAGDEVVGDLQDDLVNPFTHPDMLAALESLKTTPEERAERCKNKGNEALKHGKGGQEKAVEHYGQGLDERCADAVLHNTLYANRCAAQMMLKNWGKALADATAALDSGALAPPSALKVSRRGANAALQIGKLTEAEGMVARAEAAEAVAVAATAAAAAASGVGAGGGGEAIKTEAAEVAKIKKKIMNAREEEARKKLEEAAIAHVEAATQKALKQRGYVVGAWEDERLREQCVGAAAGARVWYDDEKDAMHWPLLLLYPEPAMSDFVQEISERDALLPQLLEMFGEAAERSPPWDHERRYAVPRLKVYAPFKHHTTSAQSYAPIAVDKPLLPQLKAAQSLGYEIPGVPTLQVVVGGSVYEGHFITPKVVAMPTVELS